MYLDKDVVRNRYRDIRDRIADKIEKNSIITNRVIDTLEEIAPKDVFIYLSFSSEVETNGILQYIFSKNINAYVPHVKKPDMYAVKVEQNTVYNINNLGINQPELLMSKVAKNIDVCIVPLLAYNSQLYRIGYGGGYYDRFLLHSKSYNIGVAYSEQCCEQFKPENHDIKLDIIITEEGILHGQ